MQLGRIAVLLIVAGLFTGTAAGVENAGRVWEYDTGGEVKAVGISPDSAYICGGGRDGRLNFLYSNGSLAWS